MDSICGGFAVPFQVTVDRLRGGKARSVATDDAGPESPPAPQYLACPRSIGSVKARFKWLRLHGYLD